MPDQELVGKIARRQHPFEVSRFQLALDPVLLENANLVLVDRHEPPGPPILKLSTSRLEAIAGALDHPEAEMNRERVLAPEARVRVLQGNCIHTIQMLTQIWQSVSPLSHHAVNHYRGVEAGGVLYESYYQLYRQNLHGISRSLPTVRPELIRHMITLLDDDRLALPKTYDQAHRQARRSAYQIIAERVISDMKTRSPFTDTEALQMDASDGIPFSDPLEIAAYWDQMGAHGDLLRQTDNMCAFHETQPFPNGMIGHGFSGMEVRYNVFLHRMGFLWSGRLDQISIDEDRFGKKHITVVDYKSRLPHVPLGGRERDALLISLYLTAQAARAFTQHDLNTQRVAIILDEHRMRARSKSHVALQYMSFDTSPPSIQNFSEWEYLWNDSQYQGYMNGVIHRFVADIADNHDRLAPLLW